jgi:hypothetical protein
MVNLVKVVSWWPLAGLPGLGGGQDAVQETIDDVVPRNDAGRGVAEVEELTGIVPATVGVAQENQPQRAAERLGQRAIPTAPGLLGPDSGATVKPLSRSNTIAIVS